jgi:CheY-like chemotaxis protein
MSPSLASSEPTDLMLAASATTPVDREPDRPSPVPAPSEHADPRPVTLLPRWILIAADDPVIVEVWAAALQQAGFRTVAARHGAEAFQLMRSVLPDLMILDLRMPELGGTAVLELVRTRPILARIPVLIISGFLDEEPVLERGLNIVGRLPKPQSLQAVVDAVRRGLGIPPGL